MNTVDEPNKTTGEDDTGEVRHHLGSGDLILNSPYEEPRLFWKYDRKYRQHHKTAGRRPAGYIVATPDATGHDDPGVFVPLPLVNEIRPRVKAWREASWPGASGITKKLLEHWHDAEQREMRFFFCQLEAIETLIWLTEAAPAERAWLEVPSDGGPFPRWCAKMATGSGKTIVMAMTIAWQVLNAVTNPEASPLTPDPSPTRGEGRRYSKNFLVIAPGLTVKNRLQVLIPDSPGNYFDQFDIVPGGLYDKLRQGKVRIDNWHKLDWESEEAIAKKRTVDKRGAKSDEAYAREVLGDLAAARDLVVINDEAHHAWRVPAESKLKGVAKEDLDEATKWIGGLDRIHRARGILRCFDFSATPFAPSGKKSSEEALFGWIVSDFGLNDAIESGLVKTPRVVVRDNGRLTADYKSKFYHIYRDSDVHDDLNRKAEPHVPLPDLVTRAYYFLGTDWLEAARKWKAEGHSTPPVMITVANRTETAARIKYALDHERIDIPELCAPDKTLHIDSRVLGQAEAQEQPVELADALTPALSQGEREEDSDDEPVRSETKKEKAERLRQMVDTVGQPGKPGGPIQNVISVGMLSEGWDAKTVTHIMGLRAFTSQLLCEQVVGRGLRRTTYDVDSKTGLFEPEYVNIFGVPFTFLPHEEEESDSPPPPPKPKTLVFPLRERDAQFSITWPNVIRIEHVYRPELTLDLPQMKVLQIDAADTPTHAELAAILEGKPNLTHLSEIDLERAGRNYRLQTITFKVARDVFEQMQPKWSGTRESLLAQVVGLVERALKSDRIRVVPELFAQHDLKRRIVLTLNMNRIVQHVWEAIRFANTSRLEPVFDTQRPLLSTADMRAWYTSRPCETTRKSHINVAVYDSTWEASESFVLDRSNLVDAWVKNEHLGFEILYVFRGIVRKYRPDYLIRLANGTLLVLEVKGVETDESRAKHEFLAEWVQALNAHGGFGRWAWDVSHNTAEIEGILQRH